MKAIHNTVGGGRLNNQRSNGCAWMLAGMPVMKPTSCQQIKMLAESKLCKGRLCAAMTELPIKILAESKLCKGRLCAAMMELQD